MTKSQKPFITKRIQSAFERANFINMLKHSFFRCKCSGTQLLFYNIFMLNFIHNVQLTLFPTFQFTLYAMCQKDQWKSTSAKSAHKMMIKLTTGVNFINVFLRSLYASKSQKRKKVPRTWLNFYTFGNCSKNDKINYRCQFH